MRLPHCLALSWTRVWLIHIGTYIILYTCWLHELSLHLWLKWGPTRGVSKNAYPSTTATNLRLILTLLSSSKFLVVRDSVSTALCEFHHNFLCNFELTKVASTQRYCRNARCFYQFVPLILVLVLIISLFNIYSDQGSSEDQVVKGRQHWVKFGRHSLTAWLSVEHGLVGWNW